MIQDLFLIVDANDPVIGWEAVTNTGMLTMYVGSYNPLTGLRQDDMIANRPKGELDFILSLSFYILSDRDYLEDQNVIPFCKVSTSKELKMGIREAKKLWQT